MNTTSQPKKWSGSFAEKMNEKSRLDVALFERGATKSRERAKTKIKEGLVSVNGKVQTKPGFLVFEDDEISVEENFSSFVGRGALKLKKAIDVFNIDLKRKVCLDIGASTGGFTDIMLKNGALKVYAVDVGHDQLDESLSIDDRVVNMEGTNFRYCSKADFPDEIEFASVDVSFISLKLIIPVLFRVLSDCSEAVCLIKPQFEAGKGNVGKNGIVKNPKVHIDVLSNLLSFAADSGFDVLQLDYSPVKGSKGNIEYLLHIKKSTVLSIKYLRSEINRVVNAAHKTLEKNEDRN